MNSKIYTTEDLDVVEKITTDVLYRIFKADYKRADRTKDLFNLNVSLVASEQLNKKRMNIVLSVTSIVFNDRSNKASMCWNFHDFLWNEKECIASFFKLLKEKVITHPFSEVLPVNIAINVLGWNGAENEMNLGMEYMEEFQDLDLSQVTREGIFNNIETINKNYERVRTLSSEAKNELFAKYLRVCQQFKPINIPITEISQWEEFFQKMKGYLTQGEIEKYFTKLFIEHQEDEGFKKKICIHLLNIFDKVEDEMLSQYIGSNIVKKEDKKISKVVNLGEFEMFYFDESFFDGCGIKFEKYTVLSLYEGSRTILRNNLYSILLSLASSKNIFKLSKVKGFSTFGFPNSGVGYFLDVLDGYDKEKFENILKEALNMIVYETNKEPLSKVEDLNKFTSDLYAEQFITRVNKLHIEQVINNSIKQEQGLCESVEADFKM